MPPENELPDGIHFGLDEGLYHELPMISAHDVKQLLISGPDYWEHSHMNTEPDDELVKKIPSIVSLAAPITLAFLKVKRPSLPGLPISSHARKMPWDHERRAEGRTAQA